MAQSHRQTGLSTVFNELLSFVGNELYFRDEPALAGRTYGEALLAYELGAPAGLRTRDGSVLVNPPMDTVLAAGDQILVVAEDDLAIRLTASPPTVVPSAVTSTEVGPPSPDCTLLIGWNARAPRLISLLDSFVEPASIVDVTAPRRPPQRELPKGLSHLEVGYRHCEPTRRSSLEKLSLGDYRRIVVLSDDRIAPHRADDHTLVTLLHLRDIETALGDPYSIVTEMNDDGNREIAQVTKADDFIVSTKVITLLLTQLTENPRLEAVFTDLFNPDGAEIYLKPAANYLVPGALANFATVVAAARKRGESAIGYRLARHGHEPPGYGVFLNPSKTDPLVLEDGDAVIVLAED